MISLLKDEFWLITNVAEIDDVNQMIIEIRTNPTNLSYVEILPKATEKKSKFVCAEIRAPCRL